MKLPKQMLPQPKGFYLHLGTFSDCLPRGSGLLAFMPCLLYALFAVGRDALQGWHPLEPSVPSYLYVFRIGNVYLYSLNGKFPHSFLPNDSVPGFIFRRFSHTMKSIISILFFVALIGGFTLSCRCLPFLIGFFHSEPIAESQYPPLAIDKAGPYADMEPTKERILNALKGIQDPEFNLNIVDLGLVQQIDIKNGQIDISITLTRQFCPYEKHISRDIKNLVNKMAPGAKVNVTVVPPKVWVYSGLTKDGQREWKAIEPNLKAGGE